MTAQPNDPKATWRNAARAGFRNVLALYEMDDSAIVRRPAQDTAFHNLESQAYGNGADLSPLSPLEAELLRLEIYYMANFEKRDFKAKYGDQWTAGGKYDWIARETGNLLAFQVRCILEDVSAVVGAAQRDAAADALVRLWFTGVQS